MNIKNIIQCRIGFFAALLAIIIIIYPLGYSLTDYAIANDRAEAQPFLERTAPEITDCVEDTIYMRYHHWELLGKIREEIVRYGKRGDVSLDTCKKCHTSRVKFCNKCHDAISMTPDCFGCHYYP
ncbi:MAG: hypothetical protein KAR42_12040 [candidate division Zixibacteria bacterium]|nr:hypothetical protein [candidate division Zixibacteria bacterium]